MVSAIYTAPDGTKMRLSGTEQQIRENIQQLQGPPQEQPQEPGFFDNVPGAETIGNIAGGIKDFVTGIPGQIRGPEVSPENQDLSGVSRTFMEGGQGAALNRAKVSHFSDEAYGERVQEILGENFIGMDKDPKSGSQIVTYKDREGQTRREFINKPGLDVEDVQRFIAQQLPFAAMGGAVGGMVRGLSVPARAAIQAITQAGTSATTDVVSGQDVDPTKAAMSGLFGGVAEGALPLAKAVTRPFRNRGLIGKTEEAVLSARGKAEAARQLERQRVGSHQGQLVDQGVNNNPNMRGRDAIDFADRMADDTLVEDAPRFLTDKGRKQVTDLGVDPDTLSAKAQQDFARDIKRGVPQATALARGRAQSRGVRMSQGQSTGDIEQLSLENEFRTGHHGPEAEKIMKEFDTAQTAEISSASDDLQGSMSGEAFREASTAETGGYVQGRLIANQAADDAKIDRLYSQVGSLNAPQSTRSTLPGFTDKALDGVVPNPELHPNTNAAMDILDKFRAGVEIDKPAAMGGGKGPPLDFHSARMQIGNLFDSASKSDKRLLRKVKASMDDWLQASAEAKLIDDPLAAQAFLEAKTFTAQSKARFNKQNKKDIAGGNIEAMLDLEGMDSPELAIRQVFGSGPATEPKKGAVRTLQRLRRALTPEEFDVLKAGVWRKFTRDPKTGDVLSPKKLDNAIKSFRNKQPTLYKEIFNKTDMKMQDEFMNMVRQTAKADLNPSKSGIYLKTQRQRRDNPLRFLLRRQGTRETFRGRPLHGSLYGVAARVAPNFPIIPNPASKLARQSIDPRPYVPRSNAGAGAGIAGGFGAQNAEAAERKVSGGINSLIERFSRNAEE